MTTTSSTPSTALPGRPPVVDRATWQAARDELLVREKAHTREGAAKRIDVLATALWNEMSVDEVLGLDLSYAPPFAPVWDPVLIAARKAQEAVEADLSTC